MSLNSSTVKPSTSPQQQTESNLPAAPKAGTSAVPDQSEAEQSKPVLSNRAANISSTYIADELNRSNTPIVEHSDPEKNDRTADDFSIAPPATSDDLVKNLKSEAMSGIAESQFKLSVAYEKGEGVKQNKQKAFMWCQSSAELGYAKAQLSLGCIYAEGVDVEVDKKKAFSWFKKAALQGDSNAQCNLGIMYCNDEGVNADKKKAFTWFEKAALQGNSIAQFGLGIMYYKGDGIEIDKKKAFSWFEKAALQGNSTAQFNLGRMYDEGDGVEVDKKKAFTWFEKAALQGDSHAQFNLGRMYDEGDGVEVDKKKAFTWFEKAALQGDSHAKFNLGSMYDEGDGVEVDKRKAFTWYEKAALQGESDAQFNLGTMYDEGDGVEVDKKKAFTWYEEAALQGDSKAEYKLGLMYDGGEGVGVDKAKAFACLHKAAYLGDSDAVKFLYGVYKEGKGVERNLALATYWMMRLSLISSDKKIIFTEDPELFEFIPGAITNFSEFQEIKSITFNSGEFFWKQGVAAVDKFIRSNSSVENLKIITSISSISNDQFARLTEALKFNTQLIRLEFDGSKPSKEMADQIEVLLAQNRNIAALRQYVKEHPLIYSAGFPLDIVPIILDEMIVANLKRGHTKEATQKAIDVFLLGVSVKALQEDTAI